MITNAWNEKAEKEEKMKLQWLSEHGHVRNVWYNKRKGFIKTIVERNIGISLLEVLDPLMLLGIYSHLKIIFYLWFNCQAKMNPSLINLYKL